MVDKIVCRCCLAVKPPAHKQWKLQSEAQKFLGLLKECFNINLVSTQKSGICGSCAKDVAACTRFRQKVINAEAVFVKTYLPGKFEEIKPIIKKEIDSEGEADAGHSRDKFLAAKANIIIKIEENNEKLKSLFKQNNRTDTKTQTQTNTKVEIEIEDTKKELKSIKQENRTETKTPAHTNIKIKIEENNEKLKSLFKQNNRTDTKTQTQKIFQIGQCTVRRGEIKNTPNSQKSIIKLTKLTDRDKHIHNIETVLECSNVTVFKKTTLNYYDYQCFLCESPFRDPAELRTHAEQNHHNKKVNREWYDVSELVLRADITDLKCNLCDDQIANLQLLKLHLQNKHGKIIHDDVNDRIIPFKLSSGEGYNCALCSSTYETFKMLNQHMNTHYSNYKCDKCEAGFPVKRALTLHQKRHVQGEYKCNLCDNVFSNKINLQNHIRKIHLRKSFLCKCSYCDAPFKDYKKRNEHMKEVHNIDSQYKCNICDRHFFLKTLLMNHVKKVHLMERNVQCTECGYKFFSKKSLKGHMLKHTGEKNHPCPVCKKAFGRAHTLREHMRIHNNDRRFKCDVCELSFVQKCSLKNHLRSNHAIIKPASEISASSTD